MLRKLESHIETEIGSWEKKLEVAQKEITNVSTCCLILVCTANTSVLLHQQD